MKTSRELFEELGYTYTYKIDESGLIDYRTNVNGEEKWKIKKYSCRFKN